MRRKMSIGTDTGTLPPTGRRRRARRSGESSARRRCSPRPNYVKSQRSQINGGKWSDYPDQRQDEPGEQATEEPILDRGGRGAGLLAARPGPARGGGGGGSVCRARTKQRTTPSARDQRQKPAKSRRCPRRQGRSRRRRGRHGERGPWVLEGSARAERAILRGLRRVAEWAWLVDCEPGLVVSGDRRPE